MVTAVIVLFSLALMVCDVYSQSSVCSKEWFGSRCQFKCRCTNNNCNENGVCREGDKCQRGWFGPSCQYVDFAYKPQHVATDGDDNTCVAPHISQSPMNLYLNNLFWFSWMRIRLNSPEFMHRITINFNNNSSQICTNARNSTFDETTLDIHCDLGTKVHHLTLTGEGVMHICSIYISGGRNVALKQNTAQSSTYTENGYAFSSSKSVDGNTSGDFNGDKSCSCTAENTSVTAYWIVSFLQSYKVYRYVLYNRHDKQNRLQGFNLKSYDGEATQVFDYTDQITKVLPVYTVTPDTINSTIFLTHITTTMDNPLQICEVEIYGDSACDSGTFGRECKHKCNCAGGDSCFSSTGGCPAGCAVGFYGEMCNLPCKNGTFGLGCKESCSQFCSNFTCNNIDGTCIGACMSGYQGIKCTSPCEHGRYGQGCNLNCSESCIDNGNIIISTCHHVTGTCTHGCYTGHESSFCFTDSLSESQKAKTYMIIVTAVNAAVGAIIMLTVVFIIVIVRRRRNKNTRNQAAHSSEMKLSNTVVISKDEHTYESIDTSNIGNCAHKTMNSNSIKGQDTLRSDNVMTTQSHDNVMTTKSHDNASFEIMENTYVNRNNIIHSDEALYVQPTDENTYDKLDASKTEIPTLCNGAENHVTTGNKVHLKLTKDKTKHLYEALKL